MGMLCDAAGGRFDALGRWFLRGCEGDWRKEDALNRYRLTQHNVHCGHGLATILTTVMMGPAPHGVAALDRLFGRGHADAIQGVRRKCDG